MKFLIERGKIATIYVNQRAARECYVAGLNLIQEPRTLTRRENSINMVAMVDLDSRMNDGERMEPREETTSIQLGEDEKQCSYVGGSMLEELVNGLIATLRRNKDLFAWKVADMPGIDPDVISHKLCICRKPKSVAQKRRKMGEERRKTVFEETEKLLQVGFIQEAQYITWLANVVLVKKSNGKLRMCIDYTYLNKACPKDLYPLSSINRLVDGASSQVVMSFLYAYFDNNQIQMHKPDISKINFTTEMTNYCYKVMPFGLEIHGQGVQRANWEKYGNVCG